MSRMYELKVIVPHHLVMADDRVRHRDGRWGTVYRRWWKIWQFGGPLPDGIEPQLVVWPDGTKPRAGGQVWDLENIIDHARSDDA